MGGVLSLAWTAARRPSEARAMVQYKVWRDPLHRIEDHPETSGWDRERMRKCWKYLDLTSRSFAAVIKELEGDMARVICIFYLVLRALDTVEDDMTLDLKLKTETLRTFHERLEEEEWCFTQSGPDEKDRIVLVEFYEISAEYRSLDESYRKVIKDICQKMGNGMAYYAEEAEKPESLFAVDTLSDFDLYCHYVAGIIGEGLSQLFSASGKEDADLGKRMSLSNGMGLHLQKTNVMRDFREDLDDGRLFWPKAIWSKYAQHPDELCQPGNELKARHCLIEMAYDALQHSLDALDYLSLLHNQSIFNFCAIPQVMAIATLDECFGNLNVYHRNVKIRKGMAVDLIMRATNPRDVAEIFRHHAKSIHQKARPSDPDYLRICILTGRVCQWVESRYPSWIFSVPGQKGKPRAPACREDAISLGITDNRMKQLPLRSDLPKPVANGLQPGTAQEPRALPNTAADEKEAGNDFFFIMLIMLGLIALLAVTVALCFGAVWLYTGGDIKGAMDRFDAKGASTATRALTNEL